MRLRRKSGKQRRESESSFYPRGLACNCIFCDLYLDCDCVTSRQHMRVDMRGCEGRAWGLLFTGVRFASMTSKYRLLLSGVRRKHSFHWYIYVHQSCHHIVKGRLEQLRGDRRLLKPQPPLPTSCMHAASISGPFYPPTRKRQENIQRNCTRVRVTSPVNDSRRQQLVLFSRLHRQYVSRLARRSARAKRIGALPQAWPLQ